MLPVVAFVNVPGAQETHADSALPPTLLHFPGTQSMQLELLTLAHFPGVQELHTAVDTPPSMLLNFPALQGKHAAE